MLGNFLVLKIGKAAVIYCKLRILALRKRFS